MRTDALAYEVHRIPSEKGEIETMPGRSYDEIVVVDLPSSRPPPYCSLPPYGTIIFEYS
jgi:hypothetical protein